MNELRSLNVFLHCVSSVEKGKYSHLDSLLLALPQPEVMKNQYGLKPRVNNISEYVMVGGDFKFYSMSANDFLRILKPIQDINIM